MKIIFVGNGLLHSDNYPTPDRGGSVQTWGISKELAKRGHEIYILGRRNVKGEETIENVNLVKIKFEGLDSLVPLFTYLFYAGALISQVYFSKKSLKGIREINPDVICLIDKFSGFFPSRLNTQKIYIMHVAESLDLFEHYHVHANGLNSIMFNIKKIVEDKIIQRSDKVVALNSFIEKCLKEKGFNNVVKIPNGIDTEEFFNKGDENFILYAGRFDWNKNVCSLINVFEKVHELYPYYNLYLIGAGPEERKIKSLVKKKGLQHSVNIVPWLPRKKLKNIMSKCSVFVLPSLFETGPVVVLEAMASAKTVIARTNMGTVDIILHGKNGYLYNNEEELRSYLELLLSDDNLRKKIGSNARKTVEEKYSFARIADKYEELFCSILR